MKLLGIIHGVPFRFAFRINFLSSFLREPIMRRLEAEHDLIRPEWTILSCLSYADGTSARDICEITEQPRNTISRGVQALESKGLIRRETDPDDARRTRLLLTAAGRAMYEHLLRPNLAAERRLLSVLTDTEREQFDSILTKLSESVVNWRDHVKAVDPHPGDGGDTPIRPDGAGGPARSDGADGRAAPWQGMARTA